METEDEIKGKALVHWKSWQEAYQGIVDSRYLAGMTLEELERKVDKQIEILESKMNEVTE